MKGGKMREKYKQLNDYEWLLEQSRVHYEYLEDLVKELKDQYEALLRNDELNIAGRAITWHERNIGFGYISSSSTYDRNKEHMVTKYIADCFKNKENPAEPVIVKIDDFYKFFPGNPSIVGKVRIFDCIVQEQNSKKNYAIIITDFTGSKIFTEEIINQVPYQENAGLDPFQPTDLGKCLYHFAMYDVVLAKMLENKKGDLGAVLDHIVDISKCPREDAQLLLVVSLLMQDKINWQNLAYEWTEKGTPLYIVAPMNFHDAMRRLNLQAIGTGDEYHFRASISYGAYHMPPLEDNVEIKEYYTQGLSHEEFEKRIKPILDKIEEKYQNQK